MKKIGRVLLRIFRHIGLFFDKWLITPITKLILIVMNFFKDNSKNIDRFAGRKSTLLIISMILLKSLLQLLLDVESILMNLKLNLNVFMKSHISFQKQRMLLQHIQNSIRQLQNFLIQQMKLKRFRRNLKFHKILQD